MPTDHQYRKEIVRLGAMLHSCGFIAATDGNLSVRLDENRVLVTPTGMSKGMMTASDLVIVDMNGRKVKGRREVTSEIGMHLLIYRMRPDVRAVVHAHPRTATGFAAAGMALNQPLVCEDLEKLVAARSRYLGVNSAARMPVNLSPSLDDELVTTPSGIGSSRPRTSHHRRGTSFQREN